MEVKINNFIVYGSGYSERNPTGELSPNKVSLFQADSLARHLIQFTCNSSINAMDETSLIELVRDVAPLWDQTGKKSTTTDVSSRNFGMQ
jgi:hypothetical protein